MGPVLGPVAGVARAGVEAALHPRHAAERALALAELVVREEVQPAPATSLNVPIGGHRRQAVVRTRLAHVRAIRRALGGTINDVVLAAATGGLRALLEHRGEALPERGLRAMVPVSVREAGEHLALGNRVSSLFVALPVFEVDPLRRYRRILAETESLKSGSQALGGLTLIGLASAAPPVLHAFMARSVFATRLFNVTITNVPGPPKTLYGLGSTMRDVIPLVPLAAGHSVGIAVVSYDGGLTFGLNADREAMPDLAVLADGMNEALAALRSLARSSAQYMDSKTSA